MVPALLQEWWDLLPYSRALAAAAEVTSSLGSPLHWSP